MKSNNDSRIFNMVLYTIFGVLLFISDIIFEVIPNVHGVALLICMITLVYRSRALIPIFIYIGLNAVSSLVISFGYSFWWVPYLYIFPVLWLLVMIIPKKATIKTKVILCTVFSGIHGLLFGLMYLPYQVFMHNLNFERAMAWLVSGLVFDVVHMISNVAMCSLIYPLYKVLIRLEESRRAKFTEKENE